MGRTKKELGLDSMGIQKSMRLTDYLGDGIGQLPLNIMSSLVGAARMISGTIQRTFC